MSSDLIHKSNKDNIAIQVNNACKRYQVFKQPKDRLKQFLWRGRRTYYTDFWALKEISFEINRGESVAIVGENGSGKSTLLQIICSTVSPTQGSIIVNGRIGALLELGSGFNPEFTGLENVYLNAALLGIDNKRVDEILPDILEFSEIGDYVIQPTKTYSSGMLLRLAFSVIAFSDPDILVVDEALAVGDIFFQQKCLRRIRQLQDNGLTLLLVSHDDSTVRTFCSKGIFLEKGETIYIGAIKECMDLYMNKSRAGCLTASPSDFDPLSEVQRVSQQQFIHELSLAAKSTCSIASEKRLSTDLGDNAVTILDFFYTIPFHQNAVSTFPLGEKIEFTFVVQAHRFVREPALGYMIKDKNGLYVFSIESDAFFQSIESLQPFLQDSVYKIKIGFALPPLLTGVYSVDLALANGKGHRHRQCAWVYDSHLLNVETKTLCNGLAGSPNLTVDLMKLEEDAAWTQ
jgi:lipopolysaccharide transport system ATP-binding protein